MNQIYFSKFRTNDVSYFIEQRSSPPTSEAKYITINLHCASSKFIYECDDKISHQNYAYYIYNNIE